MKVTTCVLCITAYCFIDVNGFLDVGIIKSYFTKKSTYQAAVVGCFSTNEKVQIMRALVFDKQTITIGNINDRDIYKVLFARNYHLWVILNADCYNVNNFLIQCGKKKYFGVKYHWLIMSTMKNFSIVFENIDLYINADINVVYPEFNGTQKQYVIEDVYNPAYDKGGELKIKTKGYYTVRDGYKILEDIPKFMERKNMTGVTLRTKIVLSDPFEEPLIEFILNRKNPGINPGSRCHFSIMQCCVDYYNFTANVSTIDSWGYQTENGSFDGLVGTLYKDIVDYGSSPLMVRTDRAQFMEYGRRTWIQRAKFIFRDPKSVSSVDIFLKPLSLTIWLLTFLSVTLGIVLLRISGYNEKDDGQHEASWSFYIVSTIAAFCQQGASSTPHLFSGRIIFLFLLVLSTMIYQFYSASLVSYLLMTPPTKIKSVDDIVKSDMKAGCENVLYHIDYLRYTTDGPSKELYQKKILGKNSNATFLNAEDGLLLVKQGGYAFHVDLATAYPIIRNTFSEQIVCELREIQMYRTQPMHSNVRIDSPYRDMFDTCLQRTAEYGIMEREMTYWHPKKPACLRSSENSQVVIGLNYFYPALLVLVLGVLLGVIILIVEIYWSHKEARNLQKTVKKPIVVQFYVN